MDGIFFPGKLFDQGRNGFIPFGVIDDVWLKDQMPATFDKGEQAKVPVLAEVRVLKGLSGHADSLELMRWLSSVERSPKTLFVTHGEEETTTYVQHAYDLLAAAEAAGVEVDSWIVPEAGHVAAMFLYPDEYERRLDRFFGAAFD